MISPAMIPGGALLKKGPLPKENVIAGNTCLYGATGGQAPGDSHIASGRRCKLRHVNIAE